MLIYSIMCCLGTCKSSKVGLPIGSPICRRGDCGDARVIIEFRPDYDYRCSWKVRLALTCIVIVMIKTLNFYSTMNLFNSGAS